MLRRITRSPDRQAALEQYRRRARVYNIELLLLEPIRRRAVRRLGLHAGDTVLDVGCGTGMSFALLRNAVGPSGRVIGIEQSPEMLERARKLVRDKHWNNVTLVNAPVEDADIPGKADAALFHFTHDILRQPRALENVFKHLRRGATVVASGLKWSRPWALQTNLAVLIAAKRSVTALEGLGEPWSYLKQSLKNFQVVSTLAGGVFVAHGVH
jgi:ubiquinone/menaquinone biosynthesis C-methylase UbiE